MWIRIIYLPLYPLNLLYTHISHFENIWRIRSCRPHIEGNSRNGLRIAHAGTGRSDSFLAGRRQRRNCISTNRNRKNSRFRSAHPAEDRCDKISASSTHTLSHQGTLSANCRRPEWLLQIYRQPEGVAGIRRFQHWKSDQDVETWRTCSCSDTGTPARPDEP